LAVVFTGLPGGEVVMPVRLPQGAGAFPRLAHYLADPGNWHKIDLVRVRDRRAPGGWRYYAHLTVLAPGFEANSTVTRRTTLPRDRVGGVDGNVSNLAVVSMPADPDSHGVLLADYVCLTDQQKAAAQAAKVKTRRTQRALDRSRRNANPDQYRGSVRQQRRADRREKAGLVERATTPGGARHANAAGVPTRAYRRDRLTNTYRAGRADHASAERGASRAKRDRARDVAARIVARHGPNLITEHVDVTTWARLWGRGVALFSPGMLLEELARECGKAGGQMLRASVWTTALSQHCVCGRRVNKPLSQRVHDCPDCGLVADRDLMSAAMATTVTWTNPSDPGTARINETLRVALARRLAAQQEALSRSTAPSATQPRLRLRTRGGRHGSQPFGAGHCRETQAVPCPTPTQTPRGRRGTRQTTGQPPGHGPHDPKSQDLRVNS
jgi:hypothetical protein